ncbi:MAG TPA: PaaI family thioesterase [Candidatus Limnocylindrales bacterium]|nr:PaaI family thioesterase [Candidatus Limnocylindrales bacterium]
MTEPSLQERYAADSRCFGCGPANEHGLRIASHDGGSELVAEWTPQPYHEAFDGVLNGGIVGTLLDCHSNWAAAMHLMRVRGDERPPACVTADYAIRLHWPTPTNGPVYLAAHVTEATAERATVDATLEAGGRTTATCHGTFIAVRPGHPAYGRW